MSASPDRNSTANSELDWLRETIEVLSDIKLGPRPDAGKRKVA